MISSWHRCQHDVDTGSWSTMGQKPSTSSPREGTSLRPCPARNVRTLAKCRDRVPRKSGPQQTRHLAAEQPDNMREMISTTATARSARPASKSGEAGPRRRGGPASRPGRRRCRLPRRGECQRCATIATCLAASSQHLAIEVGAGKEPDSRRLQSLGAWSLTEWAGRRWQGRRG